MKKILILFVCIFSFNICYSQNTFRAIIKDSQSNELLIGSRVQVKGMLIGAVSNSQGEVIIDNLPDGTHILTINYIGYDMVELTIDLPFDGIRTIYLDPKSENLDEIIIEGTRNNRSISDIPTRVEVLTEEIDEASTMDPSKIAHLITHSTGIQIQTTSATSNTANVRIQGLDGRYTQILKDGFPLYGGFSGSLSIMQIPPLDLRQVEYIKGSSSTLYGGGAISGLINLLSKEPISDETLIHLNISQIGAMDINSFHSNKFGDFGFTILAQRNSHSLFDADNDGFSDMPKLIKYNFNPRLFFNISPNSKLILAATYTDEIREGGDIKSINSGIRDSLNFFSEKNDVKRFTTQIKFELNPNDNNSINFRNSIHLFDRKISITQSSDLSQHYFSGLQLSTFSELTYRVQSQGIVIIAGTNYYSDVFNEDKLDDEPLRDESTHTLSAFGNLNLDINSSLFAEAGLRTDWVIGHELFILPRISLLIKWDNKLTTRIGGGLGYRNPTIFNQEAEILSFQNVLPINNTEIKSEKSYGGNIDLGYKTTIGKNFFINFNQLLFFTYLDNPIILQKQNSNYSFRNATGFSQTYGFETFFKFGFYDFVLFAGYTYTKAETNYDGNKQDLTLSPEHSLKGDLLYSIPGIWRIGIDYEYKSAQKLSNGKTTSPYWTFGAVVEYTWSVITLFANVENFTDVRQTNYESLKSAPFNTPQYTEIWAPLDGIVLNCGIKLRI